MNLAKEVLMRSALLGFQEEQFAECLITKQQSWWSSNSIQSWQKSSRGVVISLAKALYAKLFEFIVAVSTLVLKGQLRKN